MRKALQSACLQKNIDLIEFGLAIDDTHRKFCDPEKYFQNLSEQGGLELNESQMNLVRKWI